jgi:Na+/proline symporter
LSLGLFGVALLLPNPAGEVGIGLVLPAVAVHLFAEFCAVVFATMFSMAITSTVSSGSAEAFAVSSLICFGVGGQYISMSINPNRTGKQV